MFVYICFILSFLCFAFLFKGRQQLWFLMCINLIVSVLFMFDLWNFRAFGEFVSLHLINQWANLNNLSDSITSMVRPVDLIFLIDIVVFIYITIRNKNFYKEIRRNFLLFSIFLIIPILSIQLIHYKLDVREKGKNHLLFRICWSPNQTISNLSPIGYHIYDSYLYWKDSEPTILNAKEKEEIQKWYSDKKEKLPDNRYKGLFKGKNLILIQVESLESFVINQKVNNQEITPNLNKLLKNSLYFTNFHEQVHNGTSSDADLMANTSVFPVRRGSTFFRYPNNTYNSLPGMLSEIGYSTTAIHPDSGSYWNWMNALKGIGFQNCLDVKSFKQDEMIGLGLSDASFIKQVEPKIKVMQQPFYTFMITLTSHGPFDLPKKYRELTLDKNLDKTKLGGFFQSIHYTDKQIGALISKLDSDGILDNTIIAIYGDHEGVHKFYQGEISSIKPQEDWWLKNNRQVPFIIFQNKFQGQKIKTIGGQIDILPTIAYLMGINENSYIDTAMGRNLLKTDKSFVVLDTMEFISDINSKKEKEFFLRGIQLSDKIISSNYFLK